jgi:hypothetical protein
VFIFEDLHMKSEGCVLFAFAFVCGRVRTHKKFIYGLAFHSFTTDNALPIADFFESEIAAGFFSL